MSEQTRGTEGHIPTAYIDLVVELTFESKEDAAEFAKEDSWKAFQDITADLPWCWDVASSPTCVRGNEKQWMIAVWKNRLLVRKDFTDYLLWLLGKHPELHGVRIFYQHKESPHIELFDWHRTRPNEVRYRLCQVPAVGRCHYMMAKDTTGLIHNMKCLEDLYGGSCYTMHKDLPLMRVHKAQTLSFDVSCDTCQCLKGHMTCECHSQDIEEPAKIFCDDWKPRVVDLDGIKAAL